MPYVSTNFMNNPAAPVGQWTCAPGSEREPFAQVPEAALTKDPDYCGQCVSYVKKVCPTLPATRDWKKGAAVKGNKNITPGTVIATFNAAGAYEGHAAIYFGHDEACLKVYDQFVTPPSPRPVGLRALRWNGAIGNANNGDNYHVVE